MPSFSLPSDLVYNRGRVEDPAGLAAQSGAASWLLLTGDEFTAMGGLSFATVQATLPRAENIPSDPPRTLNLDHARQHVAALDALPRPTLVTCRMGPRSSAAAYMYAGLRSGAQPAEVVEAAVRDGAPFVTDPVYVEWVTSSIEALRSEGV